MIKLKTVFEQEFEGLKQTSKVYDLTRKAVHDNVWKLLHCKTLWMGLQIYQCEDHREEAKVVACTCKSRFCPSCGYKANLAWLDQLLRKVLPCDHQHLVFTLPYELREIARHHRGEIFNLMSRTLTKTIQQFLRRHKTLNYVPGGFAVLHTFGKGLKWHVHYHVLLTAGGLRDGKWVENSYLNEAYLKQAWKAKMMSGLRKLYRSGKLEDATGHHPGETFEAMLKRIYQKDWYVWIDRVHGDGKIAALYIGRYAKRACISQKGILEYVPGKRIRWKERSRFPTPDHCAYQKKPSEFVTLLIAHIPDRYEHQVRYFGLYASRQKGKGYQKAREILEKKYPRGLPAPSPVKFTWPKLLRWIHEKDPLACSQCGKQMKLTGILFFDLSRDADRDLVMNYEVRDYQLARHDDSS